MRPPASVVAEKPSQSPSAESRRAGAVNVSAPTPTFAFTVGFTYQGSAPELACTVIPTMSKNPQSNPLLQLFIILMTSSPCF